MRSARQTLGKVRAQETWKIGDYPRTLKNQYKRTLSSEVIHQGYRRLYTQHRGTLFGIEDHLEDSFVKFEHYESLVNTEHCLFFRLDL